MKLLLHSFIGLALIFNLSAQADKAKAESTKEAKLIYETIKDTFNVANTKKGSVKTKTKSLKENFGMASKAAGTSTAPKKEVIAESDNMVNRFQKLANIKINQ